ncbi:MULTISPECIES: RraA family protein [unclassified Methylobacterium]|jgi:regulator of RNase E activity RraA|uniref:RraA family protein n=1 Tax=unclassified Methylobacterium TaxID=2615210 RepID=UPI00135399B5|nr:dimethylmenaquinone methyltransferase [Methylobacterium sp. 2A]MWV22730.1 dimethylmenaquinone methyltransferase [Methylobacterium sp. 2A]
MAIDPTLRDALSAVTAASLARALARAGVKAFSPRGLSAGGGGTAIGTAYTLRMIPTRDDAAGDLAAAIEAVPEGAVVVIDAAGSGLALPFGAILSARLAQRGAVGLVTDAALSEAIGLPHWSAPQGGVGTLALVGTQQPVACGGAAIHPGDIVVCTEAGIVALPAAIAERIAFEAVEQQRLDLWIQREVERGESLAGLLPPDAAALERFQAETKTA